MRNLEGKVAVVTGGASGIGRAMAERFAQAGMKLALVDIEAAALEAAAAELEAGGAEVLPQLVDVAEAEQMDALAQKNDRKQTKISNNQTPGLDGPHARVTKVRDGIMFTIGGRNTFTPYSAEVTESMREELRKIASLLAGRNNKIVIRGHATAKRLAPGSAWTDLDELSFARARAVRDVLLEMGLDDVVFRLEAVGTREPIRPRAVDEVDAAENRRVEVIQTEQLVEDMNVDALATDPDLARGG